MAKLGIGMGLQGIAQFLMGLSAEQRQQALLQLERERLDKQRAEDISREDSRFQAEFGLRKSEAERQRKLDEETMDLRRREFLGPQSDQLPSRQLNPDRTAAPMTMGPGGPSAGGQMSAFLSGGKMKEDFMPGQYSGGTFAQRQAMEEKDFQREQFSGQQRDRDEARAFRDRQFNELSPAEKLKMDLEHKNRMQELAAQIRNNPDTALRAENIRALISMKPDDPDSDAYTAWYQLMQQVLQGVKGEDLDFATPTAAAGGPALPPPPPPPPAGPSLMNRIGSFLDSAKGARGPSEAEKNRRYTRSLGVQDR